MAYLKTAAAAVALALLGGCALQPAYQRPDVAPAAYPDGPAYASNSDASALPAAADIGWSDFLLDARLRQLVRIALDNNSDLRVALLRVGQAEAALRQQGAALLPQVNLDAAASNSSNKDVVSHNRAVQLASSWEVDFFGRLQSLNDVAREQYLATGYARQATHILLVSQVARQYLAMLSYDEQLAVTQETLATAQAAYKIVKLQYDTGTVSALDETLAQGTVQQALANQATQVRLRAQAENALVQLIGQSLPNDLPPALPFGQQALLADIPAGLPSDLLLRRPDVLQAEATLRAANANIGAARAAFFPRITLTAALGSASTTLGGLFKAGSSAWSIAPELLLPLFDGGARQANLDTARIQKEIDVAAYRKSVQNAFREVADGLAARGTYDTELDARQRYVASQQRRLQLAELLYDSGTNDYLSVLNAKTDLYNAQIGLVSARLNRLGSLVDLYRALGGGWLEKQDSP